jgi:hypothetical protein
MSVGAAFLCQAAGRVWFEVEVVDAAGGLRVGLAGTNFRGTFVGGDAASWAVYEDGETRHGYPTIPAPQPPEY